MALFTFAAKFCMPAYKFIPANLKSHKLDGLVSDYMPISKLLYWTLEHRAPPGEGEKYSDLMNIQSNCDFKLDPATGLSYLRGAMSTCSQNYGPVQELRGRDVFVTSIVLIKFGDTCVENEIEHQDKYMVRIRQGVLVPQASTGWANYTRTHVYENSNGTITSGRCKNTQR